MSDPNIDLSCEPSTNHRNKNECLKMIKTLNHKYKNIEKEQKNFINNRKYDKDFEEIYEIILTDESNLNKQKIELNKKLGNFKSKIEKFKNDSKQVMQNPLDKLIDNLKNLMDEIDSEISKTKEEILFSLDELNNEEKVLTKEIENFEKKINNWSTNKNEPDEKESKKLIPLNENFNESSLLKEVIDFDKFLLNNGGHNGGWEELDQNMFIRIRNKHKGKPSFIDELESTIATKNREQIEQHEEWYKNYLNLNELKKEAIKKWKEKKNAEKNEVVNLVDEELRLNREIDKELKNRFEKRRLLEKQERNKMLNEWRIEREIQKAQEAEKLRKEEETRQEKELQKRKEQEELRKQVNEYKKQKQELNEYIEMENYLIREAEKEAKIEKAKEEIAYFQARDLSQLKEKQARLKSKEKEAELKQKILESTKEKIEIEHDPSRLYRPTSSWKSRVNTPRSESCGPVLTPRIPHLAVPSWRAGL